LGHTQDITLWQTGIVWHLTHELLAAANDTDKTGEFSKRDAQVMADFEKRYEIDAQEVDNANLTPPQLAPNEYERPIEQYCLVWYC
jgi:hypothetical protein